MGKQLAELENKLDYILVKKAPFQLPNGLKKFVGDYGWIFVLVITIVYLIIAFFGLISLLLLGSAASLVGGSIYVVFAFIALAALAAETVLYGMAIVPLKDKVKRGWNFVFYANIIGVVYTFVELLRGLAEGGYSAVFSVFGVFWSSLMVVVSFYILFQVRSEFLRNRRVIKHAEKASHAPEV